MIFHIIIAVGTLCMLFVFFLVISRTLNGIVNQLAKLEFLMHKDFSLKKEELDIGRMLAQQMESDKPPQDDERK